MSTSAAAAAADIDDAPVAPTNAEDAKTFKALQNLDAHEDDSAGSNNTNAEALGKATAGLSSLAAAPAGKSDAAASGKKVVVKVAAEDVAFLVEEMEVTKNKATELLRANGADLHKTLQAMITPA